MNDDQVDRILDAISPLSRGELEEFISTQPLHARLYKPLPGFINQIAPQVAFVHCDICKVNRPFRAPKSNYFHEPVDSRHIEQKGPPSRGATTNMSGTYEFFFKCSGCDQKTYLCWVDIDYRQNMIRKVGQSIPWSIEIGKELEKDLGEDAELYKKALISLSHSYGIGACAYLRRIIENQINPLLEILLEMRKQENTDPNEIYRISAAIQRKDFTSKIEAVAEMLPESILVEGDNPVKLLHDQLSINIHVLSDVEVLPIALQLKTAFEYVVIELNRRKRSRQKFIEGIRALRKT